MQHRPFPFATRRDSITGVLTADEFTAALERYRPELERRCGRLLDCHADAEDALQDTLLRAWRSRRTLASGSPRAWLHRIATNACFDVLAQRDAGLAPLDDDTASAAAAPSEQGPDETVLARETLELALLTAIRHLPPRQHASFVLRDVMSWSAAESATALATSVPAANSALQRARRELRARLAHDRLEWACALPSGAQRRAVGRYVAAVA